MHLQRRSAEAFAEGLDAWGLYLMGRGEDSAEAEAARINVAALLNLLGTSQSKDGSWSK